MHIESQQIFSTPYGEVEVTCPIKGYKKRRDGQPDYRTKKGKEFAVWARSIIAKAKADYLLDCE